MNYKKIILSIALGCIGYTSSISASPILKAEMTYKKGKTEKSKAVDATPANVYWTDANGKVSYSINANISPVVKVALDLFEGDMKDVTGFAAKQKTNAPIQIYQLDMLSNKEFSAVEKLGAPLHQFITKKESFYIGTRKGKLIVIGSDARGTAYGIMELSKMAGVSPWTGWNDLQPQPRRSLYTAAGTGGVYLPDIEYRGFALNDHRWMNTKNDSQIARLMLRLRANTLWQVDGKHEGDFNKAVADSFDICVAQNHKVTELTGKKHNKKHKVTIENLKLIGDEEMKFSTLSPGLLLDMLDNDAFYASKSHHGGKHHNDDIAWIANVDDPKLAAYQLSVFMDKAWSNQSLTSKTIERHLGYWLSNQLGKNLRKKVLPLMKDYYRLTSIRQPAYMAMPYGDTEFHSGEFGNELERYLYSYDQLKAKAEGIERTLPDNLKDGYFELVKYPIYRAALIAEKELEAQEARHIARPGLFDKDSEAKAAAAVSLNAYNQLRQLNAIYSTIAKGRWSNFIDTKAAEMQAPALPGTLSATDIKRYKEDAFDRTEDLKPLFSTTSDIVAKNANEWTSISYDSSNSEKNEKGSSNSGKNEKGSSNSGKNEKNDANGNVEIIPLLGHSNQAVKLPKGTTLNYNFYNSMSGDARFTIAVIPNYMPENKNLRVSVSIDHAEPVVCQFNEAYHSKQWKFDLWRGQALKSFFVTLAKGNHTIEIKALDEHVILDQWVLDFDVDREYYVFPVNK